MSFFPAMLKLDNKKILVVGGGDIASFKLEKLLDFTRNITIVSPVINDKIRNLIDKHDLKHIKRVYSSGDINHHFIVVVAVDDLNIQKDIYYEAQSKSILCNSVDSINYCDFIFPSYIKKDDLIVAISTSGASPSIAKYLRIYIQKIIPNEISQKLKELKELRNTYPKGKNRQVVLDKKAKEFMSKYFK